MRIKFQSVCNEEKQNALAANFVQSPVEINVDRRLSTIMCIVLVMSWTPSKSAKTRIPSKSAKMREKCSCSRPCEEFCHPYE
ncbi:hypothetical protein vseg_019837 [Gypsophila vaccaria]